MYNATTPIDSVIKPCEFLYCSTSIIKCFYDALGTGAYDVTDPIIVIPLKCEVRHNGVVVDTVTITSGLYFSFVGFLGDIFSYKIISSPSGLSVDFPFGGVIYDTVQSVSNNYSAKYLGFQCTSSASFDLAVNPVIPVTGIHDQWGNIYVINFSCNPSNAIVTLNFSPKYVYHSGGARPNPSSVSGNKITWNLTGITAESPVDLYYQVWDDAFVLAAGDTVQEHITVSPIAGDIDPTNNTEIVIDTVRAGVDPNEMSVNPTGYINSGTQLKYTINFENTGNDTAFNISVMDTLSDNVDPKSLDLIMASAVMNITTLTRDGHNIVKFDFPNINLLDSTHHGLCDGAVIFTIDTKTGLPNGTLIDNRAGIYFDYNPVVMTNQVENIIGIPSRVSTINASSKVDPKVAA